MKADRGVEARISQEQGCTRSKNEIVAAMSMQLDAKYGFLRDCNTKIRCHRLDLSPGDHGPLNRFFGT